MTIKLKHHLRGKTEPPHAQPCTRQRPRLNALIRDAIASHRVVQIVATAGSGKTTAVRDALEHIGMRYAWVSLDHFDVSPGRLLSYLEESLRKADPALRGVATEALEDGIGQQDATALLAESLTSSELVIVMDGIEQIAGAPVACEIIRTFLHYLPATSRTVLVSREDIPIDLSRLELVDELALIGEHDLAVTVEEAAILLEESEAGDAATIVASTAGWLMGVLFNSWRSARHVHGTGGEADPLRGYLSGEIMATLPEAGQEFLIISSVLDEVTPARAEALGIPNASSTLALLRGRHLPVEFPDPRRMRCHPRLREYLLDRLEEREPATLRALRAAHADLLLDEGRVEEAVDEYLRAGDIAQAEDAASEVMLGVVRRLDFELADRWLAAFRPWRIESSIVMTQSELLIALEREHYGEGSTRADRLLDLSETDLTSVIDPNVSAAMAWCYFLVGRAEDALRVLEKAEKVPSVTVVAYVIGAELIDSPVHYWERPLDPDTEMDGMLARLDLAHGRFERVLSISSTRYEAVRAAQIGALTSLGRLEEANDRLAELPTSRGWTHVRMKAELLTEMGRPEEAWSELFRGRELLSDTGSVVYRIFSALTEVVLALRFGKDTALASAILNSVELEPTALVRIRVLEQIGLWRGLAALLDGNEQLALTRLREAAALMTTWDRLLWLPTAAVYLAEAEWRCGNDTASDAAADLALQSADRTVSRHSLITALREFPAVLSRRLDVETDPDSPWHDLGRAVATMSVGSVGSQIVRVTEFGEPAVFVDHRRHRLALVKSAELLAYLALHGGRAARDDIIASLFESKSMKAASAYLRIAINRTRELFPDEECFSIDGGSVTWTRGDLVSDYTAMRTRLVRLRNVTGSQRLDLAREALANLPSGAFLPGARSEWATQHQRRWTELNLDVHQATAEAAFNVADYTTAHEHINRVVERDPYRERAWRLAMRVRAAVGDGDGIISAYRACESALAEMGAIPADSTRQLLQRLRL